MLRRLTLTAALLLASCGSPDADPQGAAAPQSDPAALGIPHFSAPLPNVVCAGQPTKEQFDALKAAGVQRVLHLRRKSEKGTGWEEARAAEAGISFERLAIAAMFFGVITCMAFSVVYHTFNSVSRPVHDALLRLDYTGITVQIFTSFVPVVTYSHYCDVQLQQRYLQCLGTVVLGSLSVIQLFLFGRPSLPP